jgi:tRNA(fMet)-specific endonuclease VapC
VYLLDTNIVSYWMRGHQPLLERIKSHSPKDLTLSAITLAEIYYGIEKSPARKKERRTKIEQIRSMLEIHFFDELVLLPASSLSTPCIIYNLHCVLWATSAGILR